MNLLSPDPPIDEQMAMCQSPGPASWLQELILFVPEGLCREVVQACIILEGAPEAATILAHSFPRCVLKQWQQCQQRWHEARLQYAIAWVDQVWHGASAPVADQQNLFWAQQQAWPVDLPSSLRRLGRTIIREIRLVMDLHQVIRSSKCHRLQPLPRTFSKWPLRIREQWRARMLGVSSADYRRAWHACYAWLYERLLDQLYQGWNVMMAIARIRMAPLRSSPCCNRLA